MVAFTIVKSTRDIANKIQAAAESVGRVASSEGIIADALVDREVQNLDPTLSPTAGGIDFADGGPGDYSVAGFDYAEPGPGDPTVAGFDFAEEAGGLDPAFTEDEYGDGGDVIGGDDNGDDYSGSDLYEDPENYGYAGSDDPENYGYSGSDDPENYGYGEGPAYQSENESSDGGDTRPNPLDEYTNYAYNLSLHYMTISDYNNLARGGAYNASGGKVLVASAGRKNDSLSRNEKFIGDMYFDSLQMSTIIGLNARTRASNVVSIDFTIIEPLGMSLLEKILEIADENDIKAWDQMPFVLQIDFFANNDDGSSTSPVGDLTKYVCIKIIEIKIKVTTRGAEYRISAVPESHVALTTSAVTTPINLEVLAKTVKEFFDEGGGNTGSNEMETENDSFRQGTPNEMETQNESFAPASQQSSIVYSFAAALNAHQNILRIRKHQETSDRYVFKIDKEIAEAEIVKKVSKATGSLHNTPNQNDRNKKNIVELEKVLTRVNSGTAITEVINAVIRNSKYYEKQIPEETPKKGTEPLKAHKILTTVEYGDWDDIRKVYQRTITYHVVPFSYWNDKFAKADRGIPEKVQKEYYYLFTGKNQQILELDIDFNTMFFTAITALEQKNQSATVSVDDENTNAKSEKDKNISTGKNNTIQPLRTLPVIAQTQEATNNLSTASARTVEAADLQRSMMSSSRGDMINIKMRIAGDPDLIKQDDVFYPPGSGSGSSIPTDTTEIFAKLQFRVPEDINAETGLYQFSTKGNNKFSGIFKILQVDNVFERGQFTQTLDLIRMFDQEDDGKTDGGRESETGPGNASVAGFDFADGGPGDASVAGFDFADGGPGDASVAGFDFADGGPGDASVAGIDFADGGPGDASVAGIDFADGGPGDASVAGFDYAEPGPGDPTVAGIDFDPDTLSEATAFGTDLTGTNSSPDDKKLADILANADTNFIDLTR